MEKKKLKRGSHDKNVTYKNGYLNQFFIPAGSCHTAPPISGSFVTNWCELPCLLQAYKCKKEKKKNGFSFILAFAYFLVTRWQVGSHSDNKPWKLCGVHANEQWLDTGKCTGMQHLKNRISIDPFKSFKSHKSGSDLISGFIYCVMMR